MNLDEWMQINGGIAHRADILSAGFGVAALRRQMQRPDTTVIRRAWIALPSAPLDLRNAARAGGRVACVSLARRRGWWIPESVGDRPHVHLRPDAGPARMPEAWGGRLHWTQVIAPVASRSLEESPEDALAHIAECLPLDDALVLWESAIRVEQMSLETLRAIAWRSRRAQECAAQVSGLSDSGLETILITPLRRWMVRVRQQVVLAGRPVDVLIGERLVVQIDGWQFHSTSGQRAKDIAHDAELRLRGFTVLRFSYAQVVHEWERVERTIRRAVAQRLHLGD